MAVPKHRSSKARTSRKHSINGKIKLPKLVINKDSGEMVRTHRMDSTTGIYNNRQIITKE